MRAKSYQQGQMTYPLVGGTGTGDGEKPIFQKNWRKIGFQVLARTGVSDVTSDSHLPHVLSCPVVSVPACFLFVPAHHPQKEKSW